MRTTIIGSEKKQRLEESVKLAFFDDPENIESGTMMLRKTADKLPTPEAYVRVKSIRTYLDYMISEALKIGKLNLTGTEFIVNMKGHLWIVISGDHGGDQKVSSTQKYGIQLLANSIYVYGLYEASDILENQTIFLNKYYAELEDIVLNGVSINGIIYPCFLFCKGDMKQGFEVLGLGGQSSTFPSRYSLIELEHMKKSHTQGEPHGPKYCPTPELRTMKNIRDNYYKNCLYSSENGDLRGNAKKFKSVINFPLMPLQDPLFSVPTCLHYKLETVFVGHKTTIKKIRKGSNKYLEDNLEKLEQEQNFAVETISKLEKKKGKLLVDRKNISNILRRIPVYAYKSKLEKVARQEYEKPTIDPRNLKQSIMVSCKFCLVTKYDQRKHVQCDSCRKYFHLFCLLQSEEESRKTIFDNNNCQTCSGSGPPELKIPKLTQDLEIIDIEINTITISLLEQRNQLVLAELNIKNETCPQEEKYLNLL